jgi:hypothetical protein
MRYLPCAALSYGANVETIADALPVALLGTQQRPAPPWRAGTASKSATLEVRLLPRSRQSPTRQSAPLRWSLGRRAVSDAAMSIHLTSAPIVALIAGILILVIPRLLNYIVAIYLILIGLLGLGLFGGI